MSKSKLGIQSYQHDTEHVEEQVSSPEAYFDRFFLIHSDGNNVLSLYSNSRAACASTLDDWISSNRVGKLVSGTISGMTFKGIVAARIVYNDVVRHVAGTDECYLSLKELEVSRVLCNLYDLRGSTVPSHKRGVAL